MLSNLPICLGNQGGSVLLEGAVQAFLGDNKEGFYMGKVQDSERDP